MTAPNPSTGMQVDTPSLDAFRRRNAVKSPTSSTGTAQAAPGTAAPTASDAAAQLAKANEALSLLQKEITGKTAETVNKINGVTGAFTAYAQAINAQIQSQQNEINRLEGVVKGLRTA